MISRLSITALALLLAACDLPGMGPDPRIAIREAEGKAVGGACRQALRGIEDCYALNERSPKTAVYSGWKEMDEYMRENKIEGQRPLHGKDKLLEAQATKGKKGDRTDKIEKEEIIEDKKTSSTTPAKSNGAKP
jgi:hypothetical protein